MIAFTGSPAAGADVVTRAAVRRVSLELVGNAPVLVLPDAPDDAADRIADACVYNAGQSCAAPARIICLDEKYERFVEAPLQAMGACRAGRDFGPLNNSDQLARYDAIMSATQAKHVTSGSVELSDDCADGYWRPATVIADLPDDDPAVLSEVFGPLLTVQRARDLDHAVAMANGVSQALASSVWTQDLSAGLRLAAAVNVGETWLNCHLVQTAELPHGGRGASGTDLSVLALHEYQRPKTITARL
jgi:betaine-aldehyde dehydrogenase